MSIAQITARYVPPAAVYFADGKVDVLGFTIRDVATAVRASDAKEASKLLARAEERLAAALDAVRAAKAEVDAELTPEPVQIGDAAASAVMAGVAAGGGVTRLVPRSVPVAVKSEGAMGVIAPGSMAAE